MKNSPLLSIVTPCHNEEEYLPTLLQSVLDQKYGNFEHIIIDGNSSDDTLDIIKDYENNADYPVKWRSRKDQNMYQAVEKGFSISDGEILTYLNADDFFIPGAFEIAVEQLQPSKIDWIIDHPAKADSAGRISQIGAIRKHYRRSWIKKGYYHGEGLGFIQQEGNFWTRDLWNRAGGFPGNKSIAGDFYLWKQFAEISEPKTIETVLAVWRKHGDQLSADLDAYHTEIDSRKLLPKVLGRLKIQHIYSLYKSFVQ